MSARRIWVDAVLADGQQLELDGQAAHYVSRVLRCRPGDELSLFNGDGHEYPARIEQLGKAAVTVALGPPFAATVESPLDLHLIQSIPRGERMDTIVQKATELGVRRISPVLSEFTVVRLDERRARRRHEHWLRICHSACEQCGRSVPPQLDAPCGLSAALERPALPGTTRLVLQPGAPTGLPVVDAAPATVQVLIGPEGGFSDAEQQSAVGTGFRPVSLGPRVLRTETAAIAIVVLAQDRWGDLRPRTRSEVLRPAESPR